MEEEIGEYYRLIKINDEIFISRTFGNKIDGDIDLEKAIDNARKKAIDNYNARKKARN